MPINILKKKNTNRTFIRIHEYTHTHTHIHKVKVKFIHIIYTYVHTNIHKYIIHTHTYIHKVKFTLEQATKAQRGSRGVALFP